MRANELSIEQAGQDYESCITGELRGVFHPTPGNATAVCLCVWPADRRRSLHQVQMATGHLTLLVSVKPEL